MSVQNKKSAVFCRLEGITNPAYVPEPGYAWDGCMASANSHQECRYNNNGSIGSILNSCATKWEKGTAKVTTTTTKNTNTGEFLLYMRRCYARLSRTATFDATLLQQRTVCRKQGRQT
ncbi:unnamed protein product [Ceratitis capitata]|uniref:(Mediterranean fruit fly) hypothetical protein n=1 Tax=Ceratitis capitata TaxID=7213 RepID=A0A811VJA1_CERCA|nr:unnamed protein product [Ceratitis capitata]